MAEMTRSVSTALIVLATNSAVGLLALTGLLMFRNGFGGIGEAIGAFTPTSLLPGLLGSFFVFASLYGYQRLGASSTISVLVASQLIIGLLVDLSHAPSPNLDQFALPALGGILLIVGAALVVSRPV
jgi:transporter family-2 protein